MHSLQESSMSWDHLSKRIPAEINFQPEGLSGIELHDYQMHGLRWMLGLHDLGLNGILADDMGVLPQNLLTCTGLQRVRERGGGFGMQCAVSHVAMLHEKEKKEQKQEPYEFSMIVLLELYLSSCNVCGDMLGIPKSLPVLQTIARCSTACATYTDIHTSGCL
jgi:hypothetical protein